MITLSGKPLTKKSNQKSYVNVRTNCKISKLDRIDFKYLVIDNNYICGSENDISEFLELNNINMEKYEEETEDVKITSKNIEECGLNDNDINRNETQNNILKFSNIIKNNDVADLNNEILSSLEPFSFNGISGKARLIEILEGNLIHFSMTIHLSDFVNSVISPDSGYSFITSFYGRLNYIDMPDVNSIHNQIAKFIIYDYLSDSLDEIFYVKIIKFDRYGQLLIDIFPNEKMNENYSLNKKLLNIQIPEIINILKKNNIETENLNEEDIVTIAFPNKGNIRDHNVKTLSKFKVNIAKADCSDICSKYRIT